MSLIDYTYFVGEINLPSASLQGDNADIQTFIDRFEPEAMRDLLGYTLYKDFLANPSQVRWTRLKDGHEYEVEQYGDTHYVKWNGLVNDDKISLLAYYVYYYYVRFHITHTSSVGELLVKAENGNRASVNAKMTHAWNRFLELRGDPSQRDIEPTAYNLLEKFKDDPTNGYDKWVFKVLPRANIFGL